MSRSGPALEVSVQHRIGSLALDVTFETAAGWTVLFGPSGSGKSTVLRAVAGLLRADAGRIGVQGRVVFDRAAGVDLPAHDRGVRWAGQRAMLFPRMTVASNLLWGCPPQIGRDPSEIRGVLEDFGVKGLADKMPGELSGGQRQMLSVVRAALNARGRLLLLDEPFAGLDAGVRDELIGRLKQWLRGAPVVSVTHDVGEAFLLGAEVVRMREGRVVAQGPVGEVLAEERARLVEVLGEGRR